MRIGLLLVGLLVVLWLASRWGTGSVPVAGPADRGASAPANAVQRTAEQIRGAVSQGAELRASDAAGR